MITLELTPPPPSGHYVICARPQSLLYESALIFMYFVAPFKYAYN